MADHSFTLFWWNLGPFGRQDIHLHHCQTETHGNCQTELVADGVACGGKGQAHYVVYLGLDSPWKRKEQEGEPLEDSLPKPLRPFGVVPPNAARQRADTTEGDGRG